MLIALIVSAPTGNTIAQEKRFPKDVRAFFWTSANKLGYRYGAMTGDLSARNATHTSLKRSRSMKRIFVLIVLGLLVSSAAVAQKTNVDWDRQANFSQYHTYAWQKSPHPGKGFWDQRIMDAVDQQLQAKGLTKVDSNPDMWVVYSNSIHDQKEVVGTGYNYGSYWGWGGWGGPSTTTYSTWVTKIGTLVVELSDAKQHELLWRGSATDTIKDNSEKNIKILDKAVTKLFKSYPPK
jgi:hypothetical protein